MSTLKIAVIATLITVVLILFCAVATAEETAEFYWTQTVAVKTEELNGELLVSCEDSDGMIWSFYDDELDAWHVGDIIDLYMWKCTADPYDDEVIDVRNPI